MPSLYEKNLIDQGYTTTFQHSVNHLRNDFREELKNNH